MYTELQELHESLNTKASLQINSNEAGIAGLGKHRAQVRQGSDSSLLELVV